MSYNKKQKELLKEFEYFNDLKITDKMLTFQYVGEKHLNYTLNGKKLIYVKKGESILKNYTELRKEIANIIQYIKTQKDKTITYRDYNIIYGFSYWQQKHIYCIEHKQTKYTTTLFNDDEILNFLFGRIASEILTTDDLLKLYDLNFLEIGQVVGIEKENLKLDWVVFIWCDMLADKYGNVVKSLDIMCDSINEYDNEKQKIIEYSETIIKALKDNNLLYGAKYRIENNVPNYSEI